MRGHYDKADIVQAIRSVGIVPGDIIYGHVSLLELGLPKDRLNPRGVVSLFKEAIVEVIGEKGCYITPAFSYSFCKNSLFSTSDSESDCGPFSSILMSLDDVHRSIDPIFSVIGFGDDIPELFSDLPHTSFGKGCLFERLLHRNVKVLNIGLSLFYLTPIHFLEQQLDVPYRYNKVFSGTIYDSGAYSEVDWDYYVRNLALPSEPDCSELEVLGEQKGIVKKYDLGLGFVVSVELAHYFSLAKDCIKEDPLFLTVGAKWRLANLD